MKTLVLPLLLLLAVATTAVVLALVSSSRPQTAPTPPERDLRPPEATPRERGTRETGPRPYQTTATLTEDLRDALASDPETLGRECRRVSAALQGRARWSLIHLASAEASPKVRGLLVFAAGLHLPDDPDLIHWLDDPSPAVRSAAALAIGYDAKGRSTARLIEVVPVRIGRVPGPEAQGVLRSVAERDREKSVREAAAAVLEAAGLSRPR